MKILDLIERYEKQLENNPNDFNCLLFALQIPSICSRIEFPKTLENTEKCEDEKLYNSNGKPCDANLYKKWIKEHRIYFSDICDSSMELNVFCKAVYDLRCQVTHEGVLTTNESHFYFINDKAGNNNMCFGNTVFISIKHLCEDMFKAAKSVLPDNCGENDITPFEDVYLPDDVYSKIYSDINRNCESFWKNYSGDDNLLNCIYNNIIFDNPDMKSKIDNFFEKQPNDIFEIWDFGFRFNDENDIFENWASNSKFDYALDTKERFIKQKYDESKSKKSLLLKMKTDVLCLTKTDYERMLQVHEEFEAFLKLNSFDIKKIL